MSAVSLAERVGLDVCSPLLAAWLDLQIFGLIRPLSSQEEDSLLFFDSGPLSAGLVLLPEAT